MMGGIKRTAPDDGSIEGGADEAEYQRIRQVGLENDFNILIAGAQGGCCHG